MQQVHLLLGLLRVECLAMCLVEIGSTPYQPLADFVRSPFPFADSVGLRLVVLALVVAPVFGCMRGAVVDTLASRPSTFCAFQPVAHDFGCTAQYQQVQPFSCQAFWFAFEGLSIGLAELRSSAQTSAYTQGLVFFVLLERQQFADL